MEILFNFISPMIGAIAGVCIGHIIIEKEYQKYQEENEKNDF